VGSVQDVSDWKQVESDLVKSEERFRTLVENTSDWLWEVNAEAKYTYVSPKVKDILGFEPQEIINKSPFDLMPVEEAGRIQKVFLALVNGRLPIIGLENKNQHRDGSVVTLETSGVPILDEVGELQGYRGINRDITWRKEIETKLKQARDIALESSRQKSEFLANMSHEIRTPLNGVLGMLDLVLDTELDNRQKDYIETARGSSHTLLTIINDILDFSKIEAGKLEIETIDFELRKSIEDVVMLLRPQAEKKGLDLATIMPYNVPTRLRGDPTRLRQILFNLVSNAIKFTDHGEVTVAVELIEESEDYAQLQFVVSDTGIGMNDVQLERVFDSFAQGDGSTTRKYGGTGLGLAISRQLISLMGGELDVTSRPGKGSCFKVMVEFAKQHRSDRVAGNESPGLSGKRILVVDCTESPFHMLSGQLQQLGLQADVVMNADEALKHIGMANSSGELLDLIILETGSNEAGGFELAHAIRQRAANADLPIVMLGAAGERGHGRMAREAGINGYISKPARLSQVEALLEQVMSEHSMRERMITRHTLAEDTRQNKKNVLIVEDNPVNQKVAVGMVGKYNYLADIAENGHEAVEACKQKNYDLIFMDCQMPQMDGYEAAIEIRRLEQTGEIGFHAPIVAMTANAMKGDAEKCIAAGMDDYIDKPVDKAKIGNVLERWFGQRQSPPSSAMASGAPHRGVGHLDNQDAKDSAASENAIDAEHLAQLRDVMEDEFVDLLQTYLENSPKEISKLKAALAQGDTEAVVKSAHTLKGSSSNLGAVRLSSLCKQIESNGRAGQLDEQTRALYEAVEQEFVAVRTRFLAECQS
jgi:PAS domain S-box-containing protein